MRKDADLSEKHLNELIKLGVFISMTCQDIFGIPLSDSFGWYVEVHSEYDARKAANILAIAYVHVCEAMEEKKKRG